MPGLGWSLTFKCSWSLDPGCSPWSHRQGDRWAPSSRVAEPGALSSSLEETHLRVGGGLPLSVLSRTLGAQGWARQRASPGLDGAELDAHSTGHLSGPRPRLLGHQVLASHAPRPVQRLAVPGLHKHSEQQRRLRTDPAACQKDPPPTSSRCKTGELLLTREAGEGASLPLTTALPQ